jgi:hypothetical protein
MQDILYPYPLFSSLEHFLQEFVKTGVQTAAVITQLRTASDQLPLLKKTFDEKTCSPGIIHPHPFSPLHSPFPSPSSSFLNNIM